jgi:hypothetical protein
VAGRKMGWIVPEDLHARSWFLRPICDPNARLDMRRRKNYCGKRLDAGNYGGTAGIAKC